MSEEVKNVIIDGRRYRIGKMPVMLGCHIRLRMMGALMADKMMADAAERAAQNQPDSEETAVQMSDEDKARQLCVLALMRGVDYQELLFIQKNALKVVSRVEEGPTGDLPMPVMHDGGQIAIAEISNNGALIERLMVESLVFNLAPFFSGGNVTQT